MTFDQKLANLVTKYQELGEKLANPQELSGSDFAKFSKEYSDLTPIVQNINELRRARKELIDLEEILADEGTEKEMREIAKEEKHTLEHQIPELENKLKLSLLPKDEVDERNAILEVRAGTGGEEAALFAAVLFNMYHKYAERQRWRVELLGATETGLGGFREASMLISGVNVFGRLKFESGVHRVQRVPETEAQGRVHTSAATVAVLPEAEEVDVVIDDKDLRIDVYRSGGHGGQSVNTTDSAVRITHIPTGIVVAQQDERSQHKNKAKAMKILRSRLYEMERAKKEAERAAERKWQVGSGDRSERIRTYNYPQNRVTDHRINMTLYKIDMITQEGDLDELIDALAADYEAGRLAEDGESY